MWRTSRLRTAYWVARRKPGDSVCRMDLDVIKMPTGNALRMGPITDLSRIDAAPGEDATPTELTLTPLRGILN